jgi:hypothetical protein
MAQKFFDPTFFATGYQITAMILQGNGTVPTKNGAGSRLPSAASVSRPVIRAKQ